MKKNQHLQTFLMFWSTAVTEYNFGAFT